MSAGDGKSSLSNDEVVEFTFEFAVFVSAVRLSIKIQKVALALTGLIGNGAHLRTVQPSALQ